MLISDLTTTAGLFPGYQLEGFLDPYQTQSIDRLMYADYPLRNCTVDTIQMTQTLYQNVDDSVLWCISVAKT